MEGLEQEILLHVDQQIQARKVLSRMNLAKKQNSEANRMKKKTDAAAAKKTGSSEDSATEKALRPEVESIWEEVKLDEMGQMEEVKTDKMDEVEKLEEETVDLAPWCDHPKLDYWGGSWSVYPTFSESFFSLKSIFVRGSSASGTVSQSALSVESGFSMPDAFSTVVLVLIDLIDCQQN